MVLALPVRIFSSRALQCVPGLRTLLPYQLLKGTGRQRQLGCLQGMHINKVDVAEPVHVHTYMYVEVNLNALIIIIILKRLP